MTTHEVLVAAKNVLLRDGWTQGLDVSFDGSGPVCASVACSRATPERLHWQAAYDELCRIAGIKLGHKNAGALPKWNDEPDRTEAEVLALFDRAIAATAPEPDTSFLTEVREEVVA